MERGESTRKREDRGEAMQHKKEGGEHKKESW